MLRILRMMQFLTVLIQQVPERIVTERERIEAMREPGLACGGTHSTRELSGSRRPGRYAKPAELPSVRSRLLVERLRTSLSHIVPD